MFHPITPEIYDPIVKREPMDERIPDASASAPGAGAGQNINGNLPYNNNSAMESTPSASFRNSPFAGFTNHNPFDVNSYPMTNPPIIDSTMFLPYINEYGVQRRRRISISNGQIGQIINHETLNDPESYDNNNLQRPYLTKPLDPSTGPHFNDHPQSPRSLLLEINNVHPIQNVPGVPPGSQPPQNLQPLHPPMDPIPFDNIGPLNVPSQMYMSNAQPQNSQHPPHPPSQHQNTHPPHHQNSHPPPHQNSHPPPQHQNHQHQNPPPQPPTDHINNVLVSPGDRSGDLDVEESLSVDLKSDNLHSVAGVPPPNHELIYNNEVIFSSANGPIPGTAAWKKERLLERNRVAASKCRQRKKQAQQELQDSISRLKAQVNSQRRIIAKHEKVKAVYDEALTRHFESAVSLDGLRPFLGKSVDKIDIE